MSHESAGFYLREDVYFEPLINQWYAWPYLLPPVTGARHMVHTHRRIMMSFVNNSRLHAMAVREPGMAGSDFLDCREDQVAEVRELVARIDAQHQDLIALSEAVRALDELLRNHTSGESIEGLYAQVPEPLRGYVELFFDINHHASFRLIEPLLYRSSYYKRSLQSVSFGLLDRVGGRPFVLSTPRFADANHLQLNVHFTDPLLDRLFAARERPLSQSQVTSLFAGRETAGGLQPTELLTTQSPLAVHTPVGHGVRLQYLGHAGFLVETPNVAILIDPVIASRGREYADQVISFSELPPRIDYICLTHSHQDHVNLETLLQLRYKTRNVLVPKNNGGSLADPSIRQLLRELGFQVFELDDLDMVPVLGGRIVAVPFLGEHGDLNIRSKTAWFVSLGEKGMFFGADSCNLDPTMYRHAGALLGPVHVLAIGMECVGAPYTWLYGALNTQKIAKNVKNSRRLNGADAKQALEMVDILKPQRVCIYALGREPWYKYFVGLDYTDDSRQILESNRVVAACRQAGLEAETMYGRKTMEFV